MTRKLDFIVFGMPRGGTTAVAHYLSAMQGVFCGNEVFPTFVDHAKLQMPDNFLHCDHTHWNPNAMEEVTRRRDEIAFYGNKTPTYFYRLNSLLKDLDNCPAIACVRDPKSVAMSYAMRAADPGDRWPEGRAGLFAMGDALLLLHALNNAPAEAKIRIMPQNALLEDWQGAMQIAAGHVIPGHEVAYSEDWLKKIRKRKRQASRKKKPDLVQAERQALRRLERSGAVAFMNRSDVVDLNDVRGELAEIVAACPKNPVKFIGRLVENHPNPQARVFYDRWAQHVNRGWRGDRGQEVVKSGA